MNEPDPARSSAARQAVPPSKSLRRQTFSIVPEPLKVSAVLIVLNGERHLDRVLTALSFCAEVLILDSGSTDATRAIAERHRARVEHQPFLGYGPQKRRAVELATYDWVLVIDDDEVLDYEAAAAIQALDLTDSELAWRLRRRNYVGAREVRFGQWSPDYTVRLFNRTRSQFNHAAVHESVEAAGEVKTLPGALHHYSYADLADVFVRLAGYARTKASRYQFEGRRAGALALVFRALCGFLRSYVLKLGFRDGTAGVVVALSVAVDSALGLALAVEADHDAKP
jgi:glycosyltransferase involved in cell wall biosynthesis